MSRREDFTDREVPEKSGSSLYLIINFQSKTNIFRFDKNIPNVRQL